MLQIDCNFNNQLTRFKETAYFFHITGIMQKCVVKSTRQFIIYGLFEDVVCSLKYSVK
jgi:hypothetical protein